MKISLITSKEFEHLGWLTNERARQGIVNFFNRNEIEASVFEVGSLKDLDGVLSESFDLLMPNIYQIRDGSNLTWLSDYLEDREIPYIGSGRDALLSVLHKDNCQEILRLAGVPVPEFFVFNSSMSMSDLESLLEKVDFPLIVKPSSTAASMGIDDDSIVYNSKEAFRRAKKMFSNYGDTVVIEEYLPGTEFTVAIFKSDTDKAIFPSERNYLDGRIRRVFKHNDVHNGDWAPQREYSLIDDVATRFKLEDIALSIYDVVGIRDLTRFDGRYSSNGQVKIFDVNGMPGLDYLRSALSFQLYSCFPDIDAVEVYDSMINTIVLSASQRYGLSVPQIVQERNIFKLSNSKVVRCEYA